VFREEFVLKLSGNIEKICLQTLDPGFPMISKMERCFQSVAQTQEESFLVKPRPENDYRKEEATRVVHILLNMETKS